MPAPKGNDYAKEFWWKRTVARKGEQSVRVSTRFSSGEIEEIKQLLQTGQTISSWVRDAAREVLEKERAKNDN